MTRNRLGLLPEQHAQPRRTTGGFEVLVPEALHAAADRAVDLGEHVLFGSDLGLFMIRVGALDEHY